MEKQDIIKYVAIAAGAYLIYTFVRDQGYLDGLFGAGTKPPEVDAAAAAAAKAKAEAAALAAAGATAASIKAAQDKAALLEAELKRVKDDFERAQAAAAANSSKPSGTPTNTTGPASNYAGDLETRLKKELGAARLYSQLTADQWNFMTTKVTGVPQPYDLFPPDNRGALLFLADYLDARKAAGIDSSSSFGMSGYYEYSGGMGNYSPWLT